MASSIAQQEDVMRKLSLVALTLASALAATTQVARSDDAAAQAAYRDIEQTLGLVPTFFRQFPESGIAGAWSEFKSVQLNPNSALNGKTKELIGLGIAAQIPCHYCVYFHTVAAKANGATDAEIREAVAMAAIVRHWSTVLNGMQTDFAGFKHEVDTVMKLASEKAKSASK